MAGRMAGTSRFFKMSAAAMFAVIGLAAGAWAQMGGVGADTTGGNGIDSGGVTYTITFDARGGSTADSTGTTGADGRLAWLPMPTRSGYSFDGWYTAVTGGERVELDRVYSANDTLYAQWSEGAVVPTDFTITFNPNGGTVSPTSDQTCGICAGGGRLYELPTPTKSGYFFDGWYTAPTGGAAVTAFTPGGPYGTQFTADATIYAQWTTIPSTRYIITFNATSGTVNRVSDTTGADGKLESLPTPAKTGYTFYGWYTSEAGDTVVTANTVFSADATIYARWTLIRYRVTFNANSGVVTPAFDSTGIGGTLASLPVPEKNGHVFDGWYTAMAGGTAVTVSMVYNANTTIYARWTPPAFDCGAEPGTVTATLSTDGTLTIRGSGAMLNYSGASVYPAPPSLSKRAGNTATAVDNVVGLSAPWYDLRGVITGIVIEDGVTSVGDGAFYGCAAVTSVTIGGDVASIGTGAFSECAALASVTVGENVASIGAGAFSGTALTSIVYLSETPPSIASSAFSGVNVASVSVSVPASAVGAYREAAQSGSSFGGTVSVLASARVVPPSPPKEEAAVIAPVTVLSGEFTAGPNPVVKSSGAVNFFRQGKRVANAELRIYDATGNVVSKVKITDNALNTQARRIVGKWDLTDKKGRQVSEGTYLVKGVIKTSDGKSEKVSVILGVR